MSLLQMEMNPDYMNYRGMFLTHMSEDKHNISLKGQTEHFIYNESVKHTLYNIYQLYTKTFSIAHAIDLQLEE